MTAVSAWAARIGRLGGRRLLHALISAVGSRRVLRSIQAVDPTLVGAYSESDYPRHLLDESFGRVAAETTPFTLVDLLRRHEIWTLVGQSGKLDAGAYLEVGVWRGGTGLLIAKALLHFGIDAPVYLADTFTGVVKAGAKDNRYVGGEHADVEIEQVSALFKRHRLPNVRLLQGVFPEDTAAAVEGPLRLIHLDVDVHNSARDCVEWAFPRMVPGAIVIFDDYGFSSTAGVTRLCEEYERDERFLFLHNANGHAVLIKR